MGFMETASWRVTLGYKHPWRCLCKKERRTTFVEFLPAQMQGSCRIELLIAQAMSQCVAFANLP
ncbi:hypothetical protein HMPREF9069_00595 [Atopobium sp. oral taxon 810 str. F0209]|nr:hypothetical protein HMPREF9069_00595 [Atopobium sp. oral taxon 810 str. F0209]